MAVEINRQSIYTIKFMGAVGLEFEDLPASGMTDAKEKFAAAHPTAQVINIWRKQ